MKESLKIVTCEKKNGNNNCAFYCYKLLKYIHLTAQNIMSPVTSLVMDKLTLDESCMRGAV